MALYKHVSTDEVRDIADDLYAAWVAAGNPKATVWQAYTPPPPPDPLPPQVPWAISNSDFRDRLAERGIDYNVVTEYLKNLPNGEAKLKALSKWEYANYFERSYPLFDALAPGFGLTPADIDAMFLACQPYPRFN